MKLSLQNLLVIRQRDFSVLNRAFAEVLGQHYTDPDYSMTIEDAKMIGVRIEAQLAEVDAPDFLSGRAKTPDEIFAAQKEINSAADAFRSLLADFGIL